MNNGATLPFPASPNQRGSVKSSIIVPRYWLPPSRPTIYEEFDRTVKEFSVRPFPYFISHKSDRVLLDHFRRSRILVTFGSRYDMLVARCGPVRFNHPSSSFSPLIFPLSRPSRTRPTSVIATATIAFTSIVRGSRDRPDEITTTDAYIVGARKECSETHGMCGFDSECVVASDTNRWYRVVEY